MIKPLKHKETQFLKHYFFSMIVPVMRFYRHLYYSICDGKKENLSIHYLAYTLMYFINLLMK